MYNISERVFLQYHVTAHTVKYLGLVIDSFMLWHDHIYYISSKISKSLNIIAKLKRHLTVQSLLSVYCALVHPYLT